jgi:hypothetical protein
MSVSEAGATVFVDDEAVGETPMPPIASLLPGRHSVRVSKDGFYAFTTELYVEPGATTGQWVQLEEIPEPWYEKWWIWTGAAVIVAGGVTTAIVLAQPRTGALEIVSDVPTRFP